MATDEPRSTRASLLAAIKDPRNQDAWRAFLNQYRPVIAEGCRRMGLTAVDAEDVQQRLLTRLVEKLPAFQYDPNQSFGSWLRRVVHNEVCTFFRERDRRPADRGSGDSEVGRVLAELPDEGLAAEVSARMSGDWEFAQKLVKRVRDQVAAHHWQAFWLYTCEGLTAPEIQSRLGIKASSVYVYVGRVKKLLEEAAARADSEPT